MAQENTTGPGMAHDRAQRKHCHGSEPQQSQQHVRERVAP
jgi:hypothetical protein